MGRLELRRLDHQYQLANWPYLGYLVPRSWRADLGGLPHGAEQGNESNASPGLGPDLSNATGAEIGGRSWWNFLGGGLGVQLSGKIFGFLGRMPFSTPDQPGSWATDGGWGLWGADKLGLLVFGSWWPAAALSGLTVLAVGLVAIIRYGVDTLLRGVLRKALTQFLRGHPERVGCL